MGPLLWGSLVRHSMEECDSYSRATPSVSARISNSGFLRMSVPQVQVRLSQLSPLQEQAWQDGVTRTWENRSRKPSIMGSTGWATCKGKTALLPLAL